jgi:predicted phosphodiesterase
MRAASLLIALALFSSSARAAAPFAKGPYLQDLGPGGVTIKVEVDPPQAIVVDVAGPDGATAQVEAKEAHALHVVRVSGLKPSQKYSYTVHVGPASERGTFTTAPKEGPEARFTFLVYGDNRTDPVAHAAVTRAIAQSPSDFLVHTGDFVEDGRETDQWREFFDVERPLLKDRCVFACVGNHELFERAGENYQRYFGTGDPGRLYNTFRWGNTRFFLLNGQDTFDQGPEKEWLVRELDKAADEDGLVWRITVVHYGYRSAGPHGDNPRLLAGGIDKLLTSKKVDLVISGHDHIYERGEHNGMRYVVSGGGGAPLYRVKAPLPSTRKVEPAYHYVAFEVGADAVKMTAKRVDGSVLDLCGFRHTSGWDCDGPSVRPGAFGASGVPGASASPSALPPCGCGASGAGFAALALGLILARRRLFRYDRP